MRGRETAASRAKAATLTTLKRDLGKEKIVHLDRSRLIDYGKMRAEQGAGPVTLGIDIGVIATILSHGAAVHGLIAPSEGIDLARVALSRLGLAGKSSERDRRPGEDETGAILSAREGNARQFIPEPRIDRFAIATGMRQDESRRIGWADRNPPSKMLLVRDCKDRVGIEPRLNSPAFRPDAPA
ncbi:MAG: hypothetical protein K8F31_10220 [Roseovarius sp.]|nr:hypothetical protein [Roseovarius sp.]